MKVKGTTVVEVDINLKQILSELLSSRVKQWDYLGESYGKYYLNYSRHIENRGWEKDSTEITKDRYDALIALETLVHKFEYL